MNYQKKFLPNKKSLKIIGGIKISRYKFFEPTSENPARIDTGRFANFYINPGTKENFRNRQKFKDMRRAQSSLRDLWDTLNDSIEFKINIEISGIDRIDPKQISIKGKNRKTINIKYIKGDYIFTEKQFIDGLLFSQIELSGPNFYEGKSVAIDLDSDISQNDLILDIINYCRNKKFRYLDSWDIPCDFSENYEFKRIDIYLDSWHESKSEQQLFLDTICKKKAPAGFYANPVRMGETLKLKPVESMEKDFPIITIYNKSQQARRVFNVYIPDAITRLEERFNMVQIKNSSVLRNIKITTDKITNGNWKAIDLNRVFNNVFKKYSPSKYYVDYLAKNQKKINPKYFYSHWNITFDILNIFYMVHPNGIGFKDLVRRLSGKYSESTVNRIIKYYLKSGVLKKKRNYYYISRDGYLMVSSFLNFFERRKIS